MKEEKKSELIHDALGHMDDDLIEETDRLRRQKKAGAETHAMHHWRRWTALAASICVLVIGSQVWSGLKGQSNTNGGNAEGLFESETSQIADPENETSQIADPENDGAQGVIDMPIGSASGDYVVFGTAEELSEHVGLNGNYNNVFVLPHEAWKQTMSDAENMEQAVAIGQEYTTELVDAMYRGDCGFTENLADSDYEAVYHLFFDCKDGDIIHCWLLRDGKIIYDEAKNQYISLDSEIYETIYKICEMYW